MRKLFNIIFPIVFIIAGIVVIVLGVNRMSSKKNYDAATTGVIVGIEREWTGTDEDGFDQYDYTVYVDYEVDGKKYENVEYPVYDSSMQKGDQVEILYQSADPTNIAEGNISGNATIMIVLGAVFAVIGVAAVIKAFVRPEAAQPSSTATDEKKRPASCGTFFRFKEAKNSDKRKVYHRLLSPKSGRGSAVVLRRQNGELIACADDAARYDAGEHALPGHDALTDKLPDGAALVTFLADLRDLQHRFAAHPQTCSHREGEQLDPFRGQVFGKDAVAEAVGTSVAGFFNAFRPQQADLPVPLARVGVSLQPKILDQPSFRNGDFGRFFLFTDIDRQYFRHDVIPPSD